MICPIRPIERYNNLSLEETQEMWQVARRFGKILKEYYNALGIIYGIQDGIHSGQSVHHVHLHLIPEYSFKIDIKVDFEQRKPRSDEEMEAEASLYKTLLQLHPSI